MLEIKVLIGGIASALIFRIIIVVIREREQVKSQLLLKKNIRQNNLFIFSTSLITPRDW